MRKFSQEHRDKIAASRKGKKLSPETKKKMSEAHKKRYKDNPELKDKISKSTIERYKDPIYKKKHFESCLKGEQHAMYGKESAFKGKHHTEESKQKSRESQLGEKSWWYGQTQKESSNIKRSKTLKERYKNEPHYNKGKPLSEDHKLKIGIANSGENSYNWRGGISSQGYCQVWSDEEFKQEIKNRDGNKCLNPSCNSKKPEDLVGHHIDYNKQNCNPLNIITVCRSCNGKANFDREWYQSWYEAIIYNRYIRRI